MVSLFGNRYQVDPALVGATVELVFDPFDLARIEVRYQQRPMGQAVPFQLGRHAHPAATPDPAEPVAPRPSGIDYLAMVEQRTTAQQRRRIAYASLPELPSPDREAATNDHAATPDPSTPGAAQVGPLGTQLHLPTTIPPQQADQPAPDGATTKPSTDIQPTDTTTAAAEMEDGS
jgi:hypothetical protein